MGTAGAKGVSRPGSLDRTVPNRVFDAAGTPSDWLSRLALLATFGSVVGLFILSPTAMETLDAGYLTSGGGLLTKFHPSTFLAAMALGLRCLANGRPGRTLWRLVTRDAGCVLLLGAVAIMTLIGQVATKTPVTPLVDTFVLPILLFVMLRDLERATLRWFAITIGLLMCLNAGLSLIEIVRGSHFIAIAVPEGASADPTRGDVVFDWRAYAALDWRAQALFGHPLVNGLITGAFILCLVAPAARWIPLMIRLPVAMFETVTMFAFGARAALVLTLAFGSASVLLRMARARAARRIPPRTIAFALLGLGFVVTGAVTLALSGLFDPTIARFSNDEGSAASRLIMFRLFDEVPWPGLLFGPDKDLVATAQRINGLEFGIESSWIGLVLTYGIIVTAFAMAGLAAFSFSVMKVGGRGTSLVLVLFFSLASVAASMSGKITSFAITIVLILVFLRRDALDRGPAQDSRVV